MINSSFVDPFLNQQPQIIYDFSIKQFVVGSAYAHPNVKKKLILKSFYYKLHHTRNVYTFRDDAFIMKWLCSQKIFIDQNELPLKMFSY